MARKQLNLPAEDAQESSVAQPVSVRAAKAEAKACAIDRMIERCDMARKQVVEVLGRGGAGTVTSRLSRRVYTFE